MAPWAQMSMQSMQATHRDESTLCSLPLMHEALHRREQSPQALHFSLSIFMVSSEKRLRKPNSVPTGQMVLQ